MKKFKFTTKQLILLALSLFFLGWYLSRIFDRSDTSLQIKKDSSSYSLLDNLDEFHKLEYVSFINLDSSDFEKLSNINRDDIWVVIKYSNLKDTSFLKKFKSIGSLLFVDSEVTITEPVTTPINEYRIAGETYLNGFNYLSSTPGLTEVYIDEANMEGVIKNCVLYDSSVFAEFDTVEVLSLHKCKVKDVSGILEMEALKKIYVDKRKITEGLVEELKEKGIEVEICEY